VWLQPRFNWRREYRRYPGALRKLEYVDAVVHELRRTEPLVNQELYLFEPIEEFTETLAHFLRLRSTRPYRRRATGYIDADLLRLFWRRPRRVLKPEKDYIHADSFIRKHKRDIVARVSRWVGTDEVVVKDLVDKCRARAQALDVWVRKEEKEKKLVELTSYISYRCALYALSDSYMNGHK
jgi:hypothetical protein